MPKLCAQLLGEQELLVCVPRALEIDHLPVENDHAVRIDRRHPVLAWARCLPGQAGRLQVEIALGSVFLARECAKSIDRNQAVFLIDRSAGGRSMPETRDATA